MNDAEENVVDVSNQGEHADPKFSASRTRFTALMYALTCALLTADQNVLAPNLTKAARDFGFTNKERDLYLGGYISAGFFAVGAPSAILVGWLADRHSRRLLLLVVVVFGATPSIGTYWVAEYWQLFLLRMLTGLSVGGSLPLFYSILSDLYGTANRLSACVMIQLAIVLGTGAGQLASGLIAPISSWRMPFMLVPLPAILCATLTAFTTWDPPRGAQEAALGQLYDRQQGFSYEERVTWREVARNMANPTYILMVSQYIPWCLPIASLMTFAPDYLNEEGGLSTEGASTVVLIFTVGVAAGAAAGGFGGQALYNRWKPAVGLLAGIATLLAAPPMMVLFSTKLSHLHWAAITILAAWSGFGAGMPMAIASVIVLNVCEPATRGAISGVQAMLGNLFSGVGPFVVALLINVMGRNHALNLSVAMWFPAGILLLLTWRTIERDEARMEQRLKVKVAALPLSQAKQTESATVAAQIRSDGTLGQQTKVIPASIGNDDANDLQQNADA